jgi:hypothetical protein
VLAGRSAGWSEEDRLATLLGDIRQIFAERADTEGKLPSSKLVDELVAIEGRPWAEYGKARKPISQNQVARLLRRVGVAPEVARIGNKTARTYQLHQFAEAFERYLPLEGASEPKHRNKCDEIRTSDTFQTVTPEPDVAVAECEKSRQYQCPGRGRDPPAAHTGRDSAGSHPHRSRASPSVSVRRTGGAPIATYTQGVKPWTLSKREAGARWKSRAKAWGRPDLSGIGQIQDRRCLFAPVNFQTCAVT